MLLSFNTIWIILLPYITQGKKHQSNLTCLSPHVNHPKEMKEIPSKTKAPDKFQNLEQKLQLQN